MHRLQHVTLIVTDIKSTTAFYVEQFGFKEINKGGLDYPGRFLRINDYDELHLAELPDVPPSFRGHFCLRVDKFSKLYHRFRSMGILELNAWGKLRELGNGSIQMYVRDPSGNLVELTSHPEDRGSIDEAIFLADEWGGEPYKYANDKVEDLRSDQHDAELT